jgi:hypothetical protein
MAQPILQWHRGVNGRDDRTSTLFACAYGDLAPVRQALIGTFVIQTYFTALADNWRDFRSAQFGRFLNGPIHTLAARQALGPGVSSALIPASQRRCSCSRTFTCFLLDLHQFAAELLAAAVEQLHSSADGQSQNPAYIMR